MTAEQKSLSKRYLIYKFMTNLWFLAAVWLYFYRLFITDQQVGVLDSMAFFIGLLAEVPSGALADKFGRGNMTRIGVIMSGGGILLQATGSSFLPFFIGQTIMMIGVAFVSGADEALFFERLKFKRDSTNWRKLVTRGSQVALAGSVIAIVIGGWLHTINPRIPWFLTGASFALSSIVIWGVKDARPKSQRGNFSEEVASYLKDIKTGFGQFRMPKLLLYVPIILTVQGLFYTAGYGILRLVLLDRFSFSPIWGSVVLASTALLTIGILHWMHRSADRISEKRVITSISLLACVGLLLSVADIGYWGYFVILILYAGEHVLHPFMSETLNYHAPEKQRATVLSVASFFRSLPYVALAPIIGYLNSDGNLSYFLVFWTTLMGISILIYLSYKRKDVRIKLEA